MKRKHDTKVHQSKSEVLKLIGKKLSEIRKKNGYTNGDEFAYDNKINRSQYGKYEAGSIDMQISSLTKVVNALGLTLEEFFNTIYED